MFAGGAVVLIDLGFVLSWIWVRSATEACRNEARRCLFYSADFRLLCFPLVSSFGRQFRASPSCSHVLRRNGELEELVGDLSLSSSVNNHDSYGDMFDSSFLLPRSSAWV
ncbi:hypothetical protein Rs2_41642 [Raphanus sativus]|nr:hypothetical protein Rs2_41642 [Raphanus sativus]